MSDPALKPTRRLPPNTAGTYLKSSLSRSHAATTTGSISDRRQFAQERLAAMAEQPGAERDEGLRRIAASVLGFTPIKGVIVAPEHLLLPPAATVVAALPNRYGPDYVAVHFDLSARNGDRPRSYVTNPQVQAANGVAQQYAGKERYPLLVFTLPDGSGVQFVTGNPEPGNPYRLRDVARVTAYWRGQNRTALDCLERVGYDIANGSVPQRAFREAFDVQPVTSEFFADYKAAYDAAVGRIAPSTGQTDAEQFTQTLFDRLLFIHFVSRKGWLQFKNDKDYLNALWSDYTKDESNSNFYTAKLETLFFEGLNNPQYQDLNGDNETTREVIGIVPFLNGGLFERTPLDDRAAARRVRRPRRHHRARDNRAVQPLQLHCDGGHANRYRSGGGPGDAGEAVRGDGKRTPQQRGLLHPAPCSGVHVP